MAFLEDGDSCRGAEQFLSGREVFGGEVLGMHKDAAEYYKRLLTYMEEKGYDCLGDSVEVTLIDAGFTG